MTLHPVLWVLMAAAVAAQPPTPAGGLDLAPYQGQVVVLDFWASWCGPCAESFPWMESMVRQHGSAGLVVVAVNLDEDPEAARRFLGGKYAEFVHVDDPQGVIAEARGVSVMPTSILYDREGHPAFVHAGFHAEQASQYEENIVALLAGKVTGTATLVAPRKNRLGVRPWQRGVLARDDMRLDCDPLDLATDDHIYFSKEASSGGRGFGGGGCGCN
jgi:cytochrome c biogenesis protein CcmG, thiol:disulfide interchange protein DsbE